MTQEILNTTLWEAITEEIANKVNASLEKSRTYIMRFLALRGILQISVKVREDGKETPEDFWGEKYTNAKLTLKQYAFAADDRKALGQLNNVIEQIKTKTQQVKAEATCDLCNAVIGDLDDGQWDWVAGGMACLACVNLYGKEASPEHVAEVRKQKGLIPAGK